MAPTAPTAAPVVAGGRRARRAAVAAPVAAPVAASVEPRISAAAAWLFERRVHVLIATSVVTVALIGGALALNPFASAPRPVGEVATVADTDRPTPFDPAAPGSSAPIVASPGPTPSISPTSPAPRPEAPPAAPVTDAPVAPPAEPGATEPPEPDTAPAPTNPTEDSTPPGPAEDCEEPDGLLGQLFAPPCP
ncbi:hypothetical protein J7E25_01150 [Agromyces sp. ISL-38]|uniref:hypothetical protein n=1 Tax=Agromyces sp. ISL-38 TaxID=2819107 RepID=UPI001BEABD09|nr:hypothetical protein [Agromyces sp. ISL-38]MBT2497694.1 hypothetical protein [Agromyces sp. ISL-38]MBT2517222.1 hypothetical protein [Streptomyces sp. ISL-90]